MTPTLETIERTTGPAPTHSVIWLHGLGADGHDFEPIVPELIHPGLPALRFLGEEGNDVIALGERAARGSFPFLRRRDVDAEVHAAAAQHYDQLGCRNSTIAGVSL